MNFPYSLWGTRRSVCTIALLSILVLTMIPTLVFLFDFSSTMNVSYPIALSIDASTKKTPVLLARNHLLRSMRSKSSLHPGNFFTQLPQFCRILQGTDAVLEFQFEMLFRQLPHLGNKRFLPKLTYIFHLHKVV